MTRRSMIPRAATGALIAGAASSAVGRLLWKRGTDRAVARLRAAARPSDAAVEPPPPSAALAGLPPPVARYMALALGASPPRAGTVRIRWSGEFQSRPGGGWAPFTAVQHFTTRPPGFVWDARIRMLPLVSVRVRDAYRAGEATMMGRIAALVPIVDQGGTREMAQSALARWLGEAIWFPTALLPGGAVRWEPVDDATAHARVSDGDVSAAAEFDFAPTGEITRMRAMRYRDVDGTAVLTPFEGRYGRFARRAGVMVPMHAEVAWELPDGRFPYWRGRPDAIDYEPFGSAR